MENTKIGRPTKYNEDLQAQADEYIFKYSEVGDVIPSMRCMLGVAQTAWSTLMEDSEEFRITVSSAQDMCEVWWERQGRSMVTGSPGNATVWSLNMRNRFAWFDKQGVDVTTNGQSMRPQTIIATDPIEAAKQYQDIMGRNE